MEQTLPTQPFHVLRNGVVQATIWAASDGIAWDMKNKLFHHADQIKALWPQPETPQAV